MTRGRCGVEGLRPAPLTPDHSPPDGARRVARGAGVRSAPRRAEDANGRGTLGGEGLYPTRHRTGSAAGKLASAGTSALVGTTGTESEHRRGPITWASDWLRDWHGDAAG